jgi:pimeloyl-ACP methyl ester carboxylesterase
LAPDLLGFGRSGKGGHLDYTPRGLADFLAAFTSALGVERLELIAHGWGAVPAILLAGSDPGRVERLVLISPPPALRGFAHTRIERAWRVPLIGELMMGATTKTVLARGLRGASATGRNAWPKSRINELWNEFDQGTQRAILRLHRGWVEQDAAELEGALPTLAMPALVLWGDTDPWCRPELAQAYAARLPQSSLECIPHAGHWPWLDAPDTVTLVSSWLAA